MLIVLVFVYSKYISNYISKHISKDNDNINARRFCAVLVALLYTYIAILRQPCRVPCFSMLRRCWSCWRCFRRCFSIFSAKRTKRAAYRWPFCGWWRFRPCRRFFRGWWGGISTPPHPQNQTAKSGLPSQNFFKNFIFFIFAFVIEVFISQ